MRWRRACGPGRRGCGSIASPTTSSPAPIGARRGASCSAGIIDTVPANGNAVPRREGDVLHGLGSADMKGGLAVILALAELASEREPDYDLTFVWYEGEEVADAHNGLRHLFADRARVARGRPRHSAGAHRGLGRGGVPGHVARAGDHAGQARAHGPSMDGKQRDPRDEPSSSRGSRAANRRP